MTAATLADRVLRRDPRAVARAMSLIEDEGAEAEALVGAIYPHTGRADTIGITGPPGAGKSTLVDRLIASYRAAGLTVGVIAVDPTSPFSGGAVLGDRVRMQQHAADRGVFVRSMATRGHLGGLARTTADLVAVLDASGWDMILIETVGVGQGEVEIVRTADAAVVVLVPGTGDDIQALKAGIMEIADIFVVNKCDRDGADQLVAAIESTLALQAAPTGAWRPPVVRTQANADLGIATLTAELRRFLDRDAGARQGRRQAQTLHRVRALVSEQFLRHLDSAVLAPGELRQLADRVARRELDPYAAAAALLQKAHVVP